MKPSAGLWMDQSGALRSGVVVVALGGNEGGLAVVQKRCEAAIDSLSSAWGPAKSSAFLVTAPVGPVRDQPEFLNAVAAWRPPEPVSPERALAELMRIESSHGRVRDGIGGARTLDLDLLMVGEETRSGGAPDGDPDGDPGGDLVLPHARMHARAFVLLPLLELFGARFRLGTRRATLAELLATPQVRSQETRCYSLFSLP